MPTPADEDFWPTFRKFLWHWGKVDEALGVGRELRLQGSVSRAEAVQLAADEEAGEGESVQAEVEQRLHLAELARFKAALNGRLKLFSRALRPWDLGQRLRETLPPVPSATESVESLAFAARRSAWAWGVFEQAHGPLVLPDGTTRAQLQADAAACEDWLQTGADLDLEVRLADMAARMRRERAAPWLPVYRATVPGLLPPDAPLSDCLPRWSLREKRRPDPTPAPERGRTTTLLPAGA